MLVDKLSLGKEVKKIKYKNKNVKIYVNECNIEIRRDATKFIINDNGKKTLQKTKGEPVKARFIVERLVDENQKIVAQWLLVTDSVTKETYYFRWKIEIYFNMEKWQYCLI